MRKSFVLTITCLVAAGTAAHAALTFFDPQEIDTSVGGGSGPQCVAVADVDGDGIGDLVDMPYWFRGDGSGTFVTARNTIPLPRVAPYIDVLDFDLDGDADVFLSATNGLARDYVGVALVRNDGAGAFTPVEIPVYGTDVNTHGDGGGCTFDLGRDGDLDFASLLVLDGQPTYGATVIELIENDGAGGFTRTTRIAMGQLRGRPRTADMNGDGWDDLVLDGGQTLRVCLQRQDGSFDVLAPVSYLGSVAERKAVFADFDGDVDVFTGDVVLRNDGSGVLAPHPALAPDVRATPVLTGAFAAGDLDNDGDIDVVGGDESGHVAIAWNEDGVLVRDAAEPFVLDGLGVRAIALHDVDGNGRLDFVVGSGSPTLVTVVRQSGMPPPAATAVTPGVIDHAGVHVLSVAGARIEEDATFDLGPGILVQDVVVGPGQEATARVEVAAGIGGGVRTLAVTNPDRQRTTIAIELRSIDVTLRSGRLRASPAPARDVLRLVGRVPSNDLSEFGGFAGVEQGLRLTIGDGDGAFELKIDPQDPRWTSRAAGRKLVFRTLPDEFPRVKLVVRTRRSSFALSVSHYDQPAATPGPLEVRYDAATDRGAATAEWVGRPGSRTLRLRR